MAALNNNQDAFTSSRSSTEPVSRMLARLAGRGPLESKTLGLQFGGDISNDGSTAASYKRADRQGK